MSGQIFRDINLDKIEIKEFLALHGLFIAQSPTWEVPIVYLKETTIVSAR